MKFRYGRLRFSIPIFLLLIIVPCFAQRFSEEIISELKEKEGRFPLISITEKEGPLAKLHPVDTKGITIGTGIYRGIKFKAPEWIGTDRFYWMINGPQLPRLDSSNPPWKLIALNENDEVKSVSRIYSDVAHGRYTIFKSKFPDRERFAQLTTDKAALQGGKKYLAVCSFREAPQQELSFAFTIRSREGLIHCGRLPTAMPDGGPGPEHQTIFDIAPTPANTTIDKAHDIFMNTGLDATTEFLDQEYLDYLSKGGEAWDLIDAMWHNIDRNRPKGPEDWSRFGYHYNAQKLWRYQAFIGSAERCSDAANSFLRNNQIEAAEQIMAPFKYQCRRKGLSLDIADYPSKGSAFSQFPEIQLREIPVKTPINISQIFSRGNAFIRSGQKLSKWECQGFDKLSYLQQLRGNWKDSLEWGLAVKDLISRFENYQGKSDLTDIYMITSSAIYWRLGQLGFHDEANQLLGEIVANKHDFNGEKNQWRGIHLAKQNMLWCRLNLDALNDAPSKRTGRPEDLELVDALWNEVLTIRSANPSVINNTRLVRIATYLKLGSDAEKAQALSDLETLVQEENARGNALVFQVQFLLSQNQLEGLEEKLLSLLERFRESGRKIDEWKLYSYYAELLFKQGRYQEALAMQKESLRLIKTFDLFTFEPLERMKLARLFKALGMEKESATQVRLARSLQSLGTRVNGPHLDRIKASLKSFSMEIPSTGLANKNALPSFGVSLQPSQSIIAPIKGKQGEGKLTLMNLSTKTVQGDLQISGAQLALSRDTENAEVFAQVGVAGENQLRDLQISPGTFLVISLKQATPAQETIKLTINWNGGITSAEATVDFEPEEAEVNSAVIDAGRYQLNEFYGVPIYHHFHHLDELSNPDFRVVTSAAARVEAYDLDDQLVFVDANGNGSFLDPGDIIPLDTNESGYPDFPLQSGTAIFRLQVYPKGLPSEEGIDVTIEGRDGNEWTPLSISHLAFPK